MDKDRIEGSEKGIIGKVKEVAGKVLGDAKLQTDGKAEQAAGKVQGHGQGEIIASAGSGWLRTVAGTYRQGCGHLAKASDRRRIIGYLPRFQMR
ncbi:MAG: CsbD family protein, partial [Methylocella sp.]